MNISNRGAQGCKLSPPSSFLSYFPPPTAIFTLTPASHFGYHLIWFYPFSASNLWFLWPILSNFSIWRHKKSDIRKSWSFALGFSEKKYQHLRMKLNGASHMFRWWIFPHPTRFIIHIPHLIPVFHLYPTSSWTFYCGLPHLERKSSSHISERCVASRLPLLFFRFFFY